MAFRPPEPLSRRHQIDAFTSGEPVLDTWLKRHARAAQAAETARVYVTTPAGVAQVVGFYALAATHVDPSDATARALAGQPVARPVPAILLARLAVDLGHQGAGVGRSLLQDALVRCAGAADEIGVRVVLVHAKHDAARRWYGNYGFEESPTDPLHLQLLMKDLRRLLARGTRGS